MSNTDYSSLKKILTGSPSVIIYGAGLIANSIYASLKACHNAGVECFAVTSQDGNPSQIDGVPVVNIADIGSRKSRPVIVAVPAQCHNQIKKTLAEHGIGDAVYITACMEYEIMAEYCRKTGRFALLRDISENPASDCALPDLCVYMACHPMDKPLPMPRETPEWMSALQVGASLTKERIAALTDNTGDNISAQNPVYCELTATYWAWKNTVHDYMGICHYRRWFLLSAKEMNALAGIDAVLPLPSVYFPCIDEHRRRYIADSDWENVLHVLRKAGYEKQFYGIMNQQYMYNYNLVIAKKDVFAAYCAWMFPLLECIKQRCEAGSPGRQDRYIGYIGELMTTFYFLINAERLKIAHGEKVWLS